MHQRVAESEAAEVDGQRVRQAIVGSRAWLAEASMFILLCVLVWLNEVLDLPHLLLGAPRTPINWREAIMETVLIAAIGILAVLRLVGDITARQRAEEVLRQRQLQLSILNRLGVALAGTLELARVYRIAFEHVTQLVDCPCFGISLYDPTTCTLRAEFMLSDGELIDAARFPSMVIDMDTEPTRGRVRAIATRQPEIMADFPTVTEGADVLVVGASGDNRTVGSAMYVPMVVRGQVTGLLEVQSPRVNAYGAEETALLGPVANQIGLGIENARLYQAEQERRHIAETLRQASTVLSSTLELDEVLGLMLQQLRQVIPYDSASVQRLQGERLEVVACHGFAKPDMVMGLVFPPDPKFPNYRVVTTKAVLAVEDIAQDYPHFKDEADTYESGRIGSWLGAPLMVKDEIIGMIAVDRAEVHPYTGEESQLAMAFANQAAVAMENARLYEQARQEIAERKRAAVSLEESEKQLQTLIDAMPDFVCFKDGDGRWLKVNDASIRVFQLEGIDYRGKKDSELAELNSRLRGTFLTCKETDARVWKEGGPIHGEETVPDSDGSVRVFDVTKVPVSRPDGERKGLVVLGHDITERKRAEEALREERDRAQRYLDVAGVMLVVIDAEQDVSLINRRGCQILGGEEEQIVGKNWFDTYVPERLRNEVKAVFDRLMDGEVEPVKHYENAIVTKGGEERIIAWHNTLLTDGIGNAIGILSSGEDITERKRAEEALHRRAEELATLQATVLDITAPHDLPTLLHDIVERAAHLLGALSGGMYLCDSDQEQVRCVVSYQTPSDYTGTMLKYGEGAAGTVAQTGEPLIIDNYRTWAGRALVYEEEQPFSSVLSAPMMWQDQVTGVIHVLDDVETRRFTQADLELLILFANHAAIAVENAEMVEQVQRHAAELEQRVAERTQELRDAQEQLVRQEKLAVLGHLAGAMAHELRTPLGGISNAAYFLSMVTEEPEPGVKEMLEIMKKEVETSERIISSLLDFACPQPPIQRIVDVNDIVQVALSRAAVPDNVEVVRQLEEPLPTVVADPDQLVQVFGNLILNAVQVMTLPNAAGIPDGGTLTVRTALDRGMGGERDTGTGSQGDYLPISPSPCLRVSISDTGAGISEENMGKLFEPLFTTKAKGIGLGLALVKMLVEANGGSIEVESEVGKGSTFTVKLPAREA